MKIKKKYVTAIAAATIIITAIIIHCYTLGMTNTEVERIPLSMAQVGDYLFIDENNNAYVVHKENFAAVDDTSKCVAVVFALETSYEDKKKGYKHGYAMALKNAGKTFPTESPTQRQNFSEQRNISRTTAKGAKTHERSTRPVNIRPPKPLQNTTEENIPGTRASGSFPQ